MKHRIKKISLFLALILTVFGCAKKNSSLHEWMQPGGKLKILSTTAQVGDLVEFVGGERIEGIVLIRGDLNPHSYELVKGDGEKVERADFVFYSGLGLEHGASLASLLQRSEKALGVGDWIREQYPDQVLKKGTVVDPHMWMDVALWQKGIDPIVEKLSGIDPEGAAYYRERGALLRGEMERVDGAIRSRLHEIPKERRYLVTSHDAFQYFTRSYLREPGEKDWEVRFRAPEGLAPDGQLSPVDIAEIIHYLEAHQISVIFPESNVNRDSIRKIASAGREMGLEIQICEEALYGDSTGHLSYLHSMEQNSAVIAAHLGDDAIRP